jgi:hypothetical protein
MIGTGEIILNRAILSLAQVVKSLGLQANAPNTSAAAGSQGTFSEIW